MATTASRTYTMNGLQPLRYPQDARRTQVVFANGAGAIAKGTVLGIVTATGKWAAYADGNSNGTEVAKAILEYDVYVDANGVHFLGGTDGDEHSARMEGVPAFTGGEFLCSELTGLDAAGVADLGRLVGPGTYATGILRMG